MSTATKRRQWLTNGRGLLIIVLLLSFNLSWIWDYWFEKPLFGKPPVAAQRYQVLLDRRDPTGPPSLQISLFAFSRGQVELLDKADQCPVAITLLKADGSYHKWYQKQWLAQLSSGPPISHSSREHPGKIRSWTLLPGDLARTLDGHDLSYAAAEIDEAVAIWVEPSVMGEEWIAPGILNIDEPFLKDHGTKEETGQ